MESRHAAIEKQLKFSEELYNMEGWKKEETNLPSVLFSRKYGNYSIELAKTVTTFPCSIAKVKKYFSEDFDAHHDLRESSAFMTVLEKIDE